MKTTQQPDPPISPTGGDEFEKLRQKVFDMARHEEEIMGPGAFQESMGPAAFQEITEKFQEIMGPGAFPGVGQEFSTTLIDGTERQEGARSMSCILSMSSSAAEDEALVRLLTGTGVTSAALIRPAWVAPKGSGLRPRDDPQRWQVLLAAISDGDRDEVWMSEIVRDPDGTPHLTEWVCPERSVAQRSVGWLSNTVHLAFAKAKPRSAQPEDDADGEGQQS